MTFLRIHSILKVSISLGYAIMNYCAFACSDYAVRLKMHSSCCANIWQLHSMIIYSHYHNTTTDVVKYCPLIVFIISHLT